MLVSASPLQSSWRGQFWKFLALLHPVQWLTLWKNQKICSGRMRFFIFTPHPHSNLLDLPFYFPPFSAVVEMCWKHMSWEKAQIICLSMALLWNQSSTNAKDQLNLQLGQEKNNSLHKQQNKGQDHQQKFDQLVCRKNKWKRFGFSEGKTKWCFPLPCTQIAHLGCF